MDSQDCVAAFKFRVSEIEQGGAGCVLDQRLSSACFVAGIRNLRDLPRHLVSVGLSVSLVWLK